jgi:integrase
MAALVEFGFDAGAEPQEFLGIQIADFNLSAGTVHLQRTCVEADGRIIVKDAMKADKRNRRLTLAPRTLQAIAALKRPSNATSAHVFSPDGMPWSYDAFIKLWRKLLEDAEVDHLPPLAMRHTMATLLLSAGQPLPAVSARLGNANVTTTLTHYVHAIPSDSARLGTVMGEIIEGLLAA